MVDESRLFQVHKTLCKMLTVRGFEVPANLSGITSQQFRDNFAAKGSSRSSLRMKVSDESEERTMLVVWSEEEKVGASQIEKFFLQLDEEKANCGILILRKVMTPFAKKAIPEECRNRKLLNNPVFVDVFHESELVVDITEHELVPKHEVMTSAEKTDLLAKYHVSESQLPRILVTDPVARYLGLRRGQCVRITRKSETALRYVSYRICV